MCSFMKNIAICQDFCFQIQFTEIPSKLIVKEIAISEYISFKNIKNINQARQPAECNIPGESKKKFNCLAGYGVKGM